MTLRSTGRRGSCLRSLWLDGAPPYSILVAEVEAREGDPLPRLVRWLGGGEQVEVAVADDEAADAWVRARCGL